MEATEPNIILAGICGSTAHGLATENSDEDVLGVFAAPTEALLRFHKPTLTFATHEPDQTLHEAEKFLSLALKCNPSVLELLWLPEYTVTSEAGKALVGLAGAFGSRKHVHDAYLGYADSQWKKLGERGGVSFGSKTAGRTLKHARHLFRLIEQGHDYYLTGQLRPTVRDRDWYLNVLPEMTVEQIGDLSRSRMAEFSNTDSALPEHPDFERVEDYLLDLRRANF